MHDFQFHLLDFRLKESEQDECEAFVFNVTTESEKHNTFVFGHLRNSHDISESRLNYSSPIFPVSVSLIG